MRWGYLRKAGIQSRNFPVFFPVNRNFAAENRFAQACLHRQPVWDLLSPAAHGPKSIILRAEKRKRLGDRDLQPLLIASSRAKPTIFLRRQVGWFPFAGGQSHGTSFAKARREPSSSTGLCSANQSRTFSLRQIDRRMDATRDAAQPSDLHGWLGEPGRKRRLRRLRSSGGLRSRK